MILLKCFFYTLIIITHFSTKAQAYSKITLAGKNFNRTSEESNLINIKRASNLDLIFSKVFNPTDNVKNNSFVVENESVSTGRAVYPNPFSLNIQKPYVYNKSPVQRNFNRDIYPVYQPRFQPSQAETNKISGKGQAKDRFTPAEGVATALFKAQKKNKHSLFTRRPMEQQEETRLVNNYVPPKNIYSFPPNIESNYPPPRIANPSNQISSYIPPPAGPIDQKMKDPNSFASSMYVGPVNPEYLPPNLKNDPEIMNITQNEDNDESKNHDGSDTSTHDDHDVQKDHTDDHKHEEENIHNNDNMMETIKESPSPTSYIYDPPNTNDQNEVISMMMPKPLPMKKPFFPQNSFPSEISDHENDHDYQYYDHFPKSHHSSQWDSIYNSYPELIYEHDHGHDHYHHVHTTTTSPPPLPPPEPVTEEPHPEPRVKKYSYFYLGRKLWYIPLYFTVWFSFYVLWLILKSIARHKVNLPNHYVNRSFMKRDIWQNIMDNDKTDHIDSLTLSVMKNIEHFKEKYF